MWFLQGGAVRWDECDSCTEGTNDGMNVMYLQLVCYWNDLHLYHTPLADGDGDEEGSCPEYHAVGSS